MKELSIGKRIKKLREAKGLSQNELAIKAHLTPNYISLLERGGTKNVGFDNYKAIANALDIHLSVILFGEMFAPNTIQGMEKEPVIKLPGQEVLPLSQEELDMILDFRTVKDKGTRRTIKEVVQSFSKRR